VFGELTGKLEIGIQLCFQKQPFKKVGP